MFYVLPWDLILRKHALSLFTMYFYHDILQSVMKATKLLWYAGPWAFFGPLDVPRTKSFCFDLWTAHCPGGDIDTMLSHRLCLGPFCLQTSPQRFLLCHQMEKRERIFGGFFQFVSSFGDDMLQQKCAPCKTTSLVRANDCGASKQFWNFDADAQIRAKTVYIHLFYISSLWWFKTPTRSSLICGCVWNIFVACDGGYSIFKESPPKYSHPGQFQQVLTSLQLGWNGFCSSLASLSLHA